MTASVAGALVALDAQPQFVRACDWPGSLSGLDGPGLYAWWIDASGAEELSAGLGFTVSVGRIYLGQAGAGSSVAHISSKSTLRSRIARNHLAGKVRSSTLRSTLAAVLFAPQELVLDGPRRLEAESEKKLTSWMRSHLSIAVYGVDSGADLAALEKGVVQALLPPLNVEHIPRGERRRLLELRAIVLHGIDDLWVTPNPALTDWRDILVEYGLAFDGYRYAAAVRRRECAAVAEEVWQRLEKEQRFSSSFADLRCALFWLQRCVHNAEQSPGWMPNEELESSVHQLYEAIQEAWLRERGIGA